MFSCTQESPRATASAIDKLLLITILLLLYTATAVTATSDTSTATDILLLLLLLLKMFLLLLLFDPLKKKYDHSSKTSLQIKSLFLTFVTSK